MSGNKIGFAVGYDKNATIREMAASIAAAEGAGFDSGFFSETLYTNRDSVSAMTAFGLATERMSLGTTQVVRLRSPLVMAQTAATIDELTGGRFALTIGACTHKHAARNGLPHLAPPQVLREYITAIRLLLAGGEVNYAGEHVVMEKTGLNWQPLRKDIPIWIAGASRLGLTIAGQMADGILLDAATSPEYAANAIAIIRQAREAAGLSMEGFTVAQLVNVSLGDSKSEALDAVRWEIASKFRYASTAKSKIAVGEPNLAQDAPEVLSALFEEKGFEALVEAIPDSYVDALTASGTLPQVVERLNRYRAAGVTLPLVRAASVSQIPTLLDSVIALREG